MRTLFFTLAFMFAGISAAWAEPMITITPSAEFAEKLRKDYGERELASLEREVRRDVGRALAARGITSGPAITIVIEDAKPNRPTFEQLGGPRNLDPIRSIGIGGASLTAQFTPPGGAPVEVRYEWFETDIRRVGAAGVWTDANRAIDRFASKLAKAYPAS